MLQYFCHIFRYWWCVDLLYTEWCKARTISDNRSSS